MPGSAAVRALCVCTHEACVSCWPVSNTGSLRREYRRDAVCGHLSWRVAITHGSSSPYTTHLVEWRDCDGRAVNCHVCIYVKVKVKVAHTRLMSVGFRSWSRLWAVSLQVTWVINQAVGCHYFPPGLQLPPQPLRGLLPVLLLGEQRHNGCEQFA